MKTCKIFLHYDNRTLRHVRAHDGLYRPPFLPLGGLDGLIGYKKNMVDIVEQLCIKSFEITAQNGDYWKAEQGEKYTPTMLPSPRPQSVRRS